MNASPPDRASVNGMLPTERLERGVPDTIALDDLRWVGTVADAGGLAEASRDLGIAKSTLSRAVTRAERAAGAPLFDRTARGLRVTPLGERLLPHARQAAAALREAEEELRSLTDTPAGTLRIGAVTVQAYRFLAPIVADLVQRYPKLRVAVRFSDSALDPVAEDLDVSLRVGPPEQPHVVQRRVFRIPTGLFASRDAALGLRTDDPGEVATIDRVHIDLPSVPLEWSLAEDGGRRVVLDRAPVVMVNDPTMALEVVARGTGMALLPTSDFTRHAGDGTLVPLLPGWRGPALDVFAVMPPGRTKVPAVRALLDLIAERARTSPPH